tara:strand:+ start:756 stop:983 length:228 start_codon:yes stop_codon:yes gene_type:complete
MNQEHYLEENPNHTDKEHGRFLDDHIETMGYTWEQVSPEGKRIAKKLASDLGCTEIEAYQSLVHHMIDPHCYENP